MINKVLSEIVHCLNCGASLSIDEENEQLKCKKCGTSYPVKNSVAVMLPSQEAKNTAEPEIHAKQSSVFNYIDHYQKDGIEHNYFQKRDSGTEHIERRVREYVFSQIKNETGRILDVGCGRAWGAQHLCPENYEVISMDISLENTTEALKIYPFKNHSAVVADVFSLPFNENTFDYIIASEIIEHVIDPKAFIENLIRALKPGGTLIVTTPYKEKIKYSLCVHCNKLTPLHAHIHSFDEKILSSLYTRKDLQSCNYITFANKIPIHLRMHVFFRFFGFRCWKIVDRFFNLFYKSPLRILVKWQKK
ncbi:methyltransferase domain-containing protein [Draconibacterium orientale]|uniref:methyltransferase domain-containing protein n=1 Tax=Draconibacterium orientale TaxID=1168034 RepID=UPI0029C05D0D|nr:methyltransferase domain-containing protein [Draconibacterium orientale]